MSDTKNIPPILLDLDGLAEWLKVSRHTAEILAKNFPSFDLGERIKRFDPEEVLEFLRQERTLKQQHAQDTAGLHAQKSTWKAEGQAEPKRIGRRN
jgi:hypothetical protein